MRLNNKIAIITGGGGDIGCASAKKFLEEGASVVLVDYNADLLKKAEETFAQYKDKVRIYVANVKHLYEMENAAAFTIKEFGRIDILLTCAGIAKHMPIDQMPVEVWNDVMDTNIDGVFNSCKAVVPEMKKNNYGRIVHISSLGGRTGRPGVGVNYAASKAAVIGLTQLLSYELGPNNITVNSVAPGPLNGRMTGTFSPEMVARLKNGVRIERLGLPEEVAYAVVYLASDEAGWTTGEVLDVNGGLYY
ncbi:MAG: 3-oxoacyl-(acyl-carrier-protein) reductase [Clostridia bacterium]|jgi:NAD(P)-dependent dehydrogenase (short-subunit alcohol dehydrogenase family)|nr:3-oxoacyl-(acyl-carrier-protein) reductase [Clostridia bacterium]